jgi:hypothetical protein
MINIISKQIVYAGPQAGMGYRQGNGRMAVRADYFDEKAASWPLLVDCFSDKDLHGMDF